jgi:hypothetical protein
MTLVNMLLHHLIAEKEHVNERVQDLLDALLAHPSTHTKTSDWARAITMKTYISEVASLSSHEHGLHYLVTGITEEKLRSFEIDTVTRIMSAGAPCLWELVGALLEANSDLNSRRDKLREQAAKKRSGGKKGPSRPTGTKVNSRPTASTTDERIWEFLDQSVPVIDNNEDIPDDIVEPEEQSEEGLATIVSCFRW